jgi:hypothetical protein
MKILLLVNRNLYAELLTITDFHPIRKSKARHKHIPNSCVFYVSMVNLKFPKVFSPVQVSPENNFGKINTLSSTAVNTGVCAIAPKAQCITS